MQCLSRAIFLQLTTVLPGTLFVLVKDITPKQRLLEACQSKGCTRAEVEGLIEQLVTASSSEGDRRPAQSPRAVGKWRLRWSAQVCWSWDASLCCHLKWKVSALTCRLPACDLMAACACADSDALLT